MLEGDVSIATLPLSVPNREPKSATNPRVIRRRNADHIRLEMPLISSGIVDDLKARLSNVVELGTLVHAAHAELRMEQRGVTEVDVRAMLERATAFRTERRRGPVPDPGEKSARTVPSGDGLLVIDYGQNGKAIGVEITAPSAVPLDRLNRVLADLGETPLSEHDYLPVRAA